MDRQKTIWISIGAVGVVALLVLFFLTRTVPTSVPDANAWNREEALQTLHRLNAYADSVGVDTAQYAAPAAPTQATVENKLQRLLTELRYGKKIDGLMQQKLPERIDTAWVNGLARRPQPVLADSLRAAPVFGPYGQLVAHYHRLRAGGATDTLRAVRKTLNYYRWLARFELDQFIVVNIPAAELNVYDRSGKRLMPMQVIAGSQKNATPLFTSYLTDITAYPYWNVPEGIAVSELLPKIQNDPGFIDSQNLEVLDKRERVVDAYAIDWGSLSADNFPYRIRQTSGCHNSLGLIKFNLTGPGAIYMHDTNARTLFTATTDRWRSHGCMRLEKPVEFANYLLGETKFDEGFYNRCLIDQKPSTFPLPRKYPVFVVYNLADVDAAGQLRLYRDVYNRMM